MSKAKNNDNESPKERQPDAELSNSSLVGRRVKLVGKHPHAGKTGVIKSVELLALNNKYVPVVALDNNKGNCLVNDSKQIVFLDSSEYKPDLKNNKSSQISGDREAGYKLPGNEELIDTFFLYKGNVEAVSRHYGLKNSRRVFQVIAESKELQEGLKLSRISKAYWAEDKLMSRINGYDYIEDKVFQFQGVPLIVPTIKHIPPDVGAAIAYLNANGKELGYGKVEEELKDKPKTYEERMKEMNQRSQELDNDDE